jgi:hypothetical protein
MKKYAIVSVNDNVDYLYYLPLTIWSWKRIGWEVIVFYNGENNDILKYVKDIITVNSIYELKPQEGYRSDTITQISRLYGTCVNDGYLMTIDIDMLALSDYWQPNKEKITVYGHDLTGFTDYPICYIGMDSL